MAMDVYIQFFAKHLLKMDSLKLCRQLTPILTQNRKYIIFNLVVFFFWKSDTEAFGVIQPCSPLYFVTLHVRSDQV
ncbi:hypothetical protein QFZ20_002819 [Flavobacterium sp. W4I14]|nr:hypothetical protein [Flavobacterium sp. W4I14]